MKRVWMVLMAAWVMTVIAMSPVLLYAYTDLETMGKLSEETRDVFGRHRIVILLQGNDGTLPRDEYISMRSVYIETPIKVEAGTIIHFNYAENIAMKGLFIVSSLVFEPGCVLDAINITDSATPVWGGIRVKQSGGLEADGLKIEGVTGAMMESNGNIALKNMSLIWIVHVKGNFFVDNSQIKDLLFLGDTQVTIQNTTFELGTEDINTKGVHISFPLFKEGKAILYNNNQWVGNGSKPLISFGNTRGEETITSDPKELAERNILIEPPTAVLQKTWGEIKKLFRK